MNICIYCIREFDSLTNDHLFPRSWYPLSYSGQKPKVPSCKQCNNKHGAVENRLKNTIGLTMDPRDPEYQPLWESANSALDPSRGKSEKDRIQRLNKLNSTTRSLLIGDQVPKDRIYPGFNLGPHILNGFQGAIPLSEKDLSKFSEKLVRGFSYLDGIIIPATFETESSGDIYSNSNEADSLLSRFGKTTELGSFFSMTRVVLEDGLGSLFRYTLWNRLVRYGFTHPPRIQSPGESFSG